MKAKLIFVIALAVGAYAYVMEFGTDADRCTITPHCYTWIAK